MSGGEAPSKLHGGSQACRALQHASRVAAQPTKVCLRLLCFLWVGELVQPLLGLSVVVLLLAAALLVEVALWRQAAAAGGLEDAPLLRLDEAAEVSEKRAAAGEISAAPLPVLLSTVPAAVRTHLVAHRGFHCPEMREERPLEGSLAAYTAAWRAGVKIAECDVRLTCDGHVVLAHDDRLHAASGACVSVSSSTLAEVHAVRLQRGERVVSLVEVLEAACSLDGKLVVELKPSAGVGRAVARLFESRPDLKAACEIVMAFGLEDLCDYVEERALTPTLLEASEPTTLLLTAARCSGEEEYMAVEQLLDLAGDWGSVIERIRERGIDGVYMEWTPELTHKHAAQVRQLCATCKAVGVWQYFGQTDHRDEAQELMSLGIDYVNTDFPRGFFGEA